jgi:hypothetical protein
MLDSSLAWLSGELEEEMEEAWWMLLGLPLVALLFCFRIEAVFTD